MSIQTRSGKIDLKEIKTIIQETISELFSDEKFINVILKKFTDKFEQKMGEMNEVIKNNKYKIKVLEQKIDNFEQMEKVNNVCIYGLCEEKGEKLNLKLLEEIGKITEINYKNEDILSAYRVGKSINPQKPRPVIIKFNTYENKSKLIKNSNKFKNTKLFITEDLTKIRIELLNIAKSKLGTKCVWPFNGSIFAKINDNTLKIRSLEHLEEF